MEEKEELFTCNVTLITEAYDSTSSAQVTCSKGETSETYAVALRGDAFINGNFVPSAEIEKSLSAWEGTLHDINHRGTGILPGTADITYFIGWNSNVKYDKATKSLSMKINIADNTLHASAWRGYVDLCKASGRTPNVSVSFYAKRKRVRASDLPEGSNYLAQGYSKEDEVWAVSDIRPQALSTVFEGACSDSQGCGIGKCSCELEAAETPVVETPIAEVPVVTEEEKTRILKEREKIIEWLKSHEK